MNQLLKKGGMLLLFVLCTLNALLPVQAAPPEASLQLKVQCSQAGQLKIHAGDEIVLTVRNEQIERNLKNVNAAEIEVLADDGAQIEKLAVNGERISEAAGQSCWKIPYSSDKTQSLDVECTFTSKSARSSQQSSAALSASSQKESEALETSIEKKKTESAADGSSSAASALSTKNSSSSVASQSSQDSATSLSQKDSQESEQHVDEQTLESLIGVQILNEAGIPVPGVARQGEMSEFIRRLQTESRQGAMLMASSLKVTSVRVLSSVKMTSGSLQSNGVWQLSNGRTAYCAIYSNAEPLPGMEADPPVEVNNPALRKVLYYGLDGPGNLLKDSGYNPDQQIIIMDDLVSMAYCGSCISKEASSLATWEQVVRPLWEMIQAKPDPSGFKAMIVNVHGTGLNYLNQQKNVQPLAYGEAVKNGYLYVLKKSSNTAMSGTNTALYSLEGAQFNVSRVLGGGRFRYITTLVTDASGRTETACLEPGRYEIEERSPSKGYLLNNTKLEVDVLEGQTATEARARVDWDEEPGYCQPKILIRKVNAMQEYSKALSLANAQFRLSWYDVAVHTALESLPSSPKRTWIYKTDEQGEVKLDNDHYVSGDPRFFNPQNEVVIPYGVLKIEEIQAPPGFAIETQVYVVPIGLPADHGTASIAFKNPLIIRENLKDIEILKVDADSEQPLAGAEFKVTKPDGTTQTLTTDAKGKAYVQLRQKGTYSIVETKAPGGYVPDSSAAVFYVKDTVRFAGGNGMASFDGKTVVLRWKNRKDLFEMRVRKRGEDRKPLAGAKFTLYADAKRSRAIATCTSTADGMASFGLIHTGKYWVEETEPPAGYMGEKDADGKPVLHAITASYSAQDNRIVFMADGQAVSTDAPVFASDYDVENDFRELLVWTLDNEKQRVLPRTGSGWHAGLAAAGSLMAAGPLCLSSFRRKRTASLEKRE